METIHTNNTEVDPKGFSRVASIYFYMFFTLRNSFNIDKGKGQPIIYNCF